MFLYTHLTTLTRNQKTENTYYQEDGGKGKQINFKFGSFITNVGKFETIFGNW